MRSVPLHGRDDLLRAVIGLLDSARRVSLLGPGGVGKTRLAQAVLGSRPGHWVDLHDAHTLNEVTRVVADALDLDGDRLVPAAEVAEPTLVVLDNCEQLDQAAIDRLDEVFSDRWPVLTTSRRALGWAGEHRVEVPVLAHGSAEQVFRDAAPRDFIEEASEVATLGRVIERLEGLPLALRLAAGRLDVVNLATLERLLEDRYLRVLADPDVGGRHGSIGDAVAWSWQQLDEPGRAALAATAAFPGPFDLDAATALLDDDALDRLHALVRRHLVQVDDGRFRLLEPVRRYATQRLAERADAPKLIARVDEWLADRARRWARDLRTVGQARVVREAAAGWRGLTRVVEGAPDADACQAFAVLAEVVESRGPGTEGLRWATVLLGREVSAHTRARALAWRSRWARRLGDVESAQQDADAAVGLGAGGDAGARALLERSSLRLQRGLEGAHDRRRELEAALRLAESDGCRAVLLAHHALVLHDEHDNHAADVRLEEALVAAEAAEEPAVMLEVHAKAGTIHLERALDVGAAERSLSRARRLARQLGRRRKEGFLTGQLALLAHVAGSPERSLPLYDQAIRVLREAGDLVAAATYVGVRSRVELFHGDPARARADLEASIGWLDRAGDRRLYLSQITLLAAEAAVRGDRARVETLLGSQVPRREPEAQQLQAVRTLAEGIEAAERGDGAARDRAVARARALVGSGYHAVATMSAWTVERLEETRAWWRVDLAGRWHEPPDGERVTVTATAHARVLAHLVALRVAEPGRCAGVTALASAGWPGEQLVAKSAGNRVRVALSKLRAAGLSELIERGHAGWRLSPEVLVRPTRGLAAGGEP